MTVAPEDGGIQAERRRLTDSLLFGNDGDREQRVVEMVAPMVRYSKLPFRLLCRRWGSRITFTPMIIAESFNRSSDSRDSDFSTCELDRPLVVQFATNSPDELAAAVSKVTPYVDAIDVNCGCPQRWAIQEGIGAALSAQPERVRDLITAATSRTHLPVSIKIRLHKNFE
jgi:tRNA-dihydrouridine synthase 4